MPRCDVCCHDSDSPPRHHSFYVDGSEGVNLCSSCEFAVVKFIRERKSVAHAARLQALKDIKKEEQKDPVVSEPDIVHPPSCYVTYTKPS